MWIWPDRCGCPEEAAAILAAKEKELSDMDDEDKKAYRMKLDQAGLSGLLNGYTFENFCPRSEWAEAGAIKSRVMQYAVTVATGKAEQKPWLVLYGGFGMGKSHLAGACIRYAIENGMTGCYFRVWPRYLSRLQASWDRRERKSNAYSDIVGDEYMAEAEADIIAELTRGQFVVIDDLDKQDASQWVKKVLFDVLNTRYNAQLPTILTFNNPLLAAYPGGRLLLDDYIGRAVVDRIIEHAFDVLAFNGPSFRSGL